MQVDHETSASLAAALPPGRQYVLSNADLREHYGLRRISAGARWRIARDLELAGLQLISDPDHEPLVVARPQADAAAHGAAPERGEKRRRTPFRLGAVFSALVGAAGVVAVWETADVQRGACQGVLSRAPVARAAVMTRCAARYRPVDRADAQTAIDTFFARTSGAAPLAGWRMLSSAARAAQGQSAWKATWTPSLWADTSRVRRAGAYNVYAVDVRDYRPGDVRARRWRMRVRHVTDGDFEIDRIDPPARLDVPVRGVRRVRYAAAVNLTRQPRKGAPVELFARSGEIRVGGELWAMCELRTAGASGSPRWWTRTNLGWIPNTGLERRRDGPVGDLETCDRHWAATT
jgi:hypothetical protein